MKAVIVNRKSQQLRVVDLEKITISEYIKKYSKKWEIVKYIHR